jgi:hypothetical protein
MILFMNDSIDKQGLRVIFSELLNYGNAKLANYPFVLNKHRLRKQLLHLMMAATQSYSEAIFKLLDSPVYDKAAEVLYRSITENLINLNYLYSVRSEHNAVIFLAVSLIERNNFSRDYKDIMKKYPSWNLEFANNKNETDWDNFILKNTQTINEYEKRFGVKLPQKYPDLKTRAIACDTNLKQKGKLKQGNCLELSYVQFYRFFSQISHLSMPGLERFMRFDTLGNSKIVIDGDDKDSLRVLAITYIHYFVILRFTLQILKIYSGEEYKKFSRFAKLISKGNLNV